MQVWTIPNIITMARIVLIFIFGYLLVTEQDGWAITVLAIAGVSDFLDGYLARRWNQSTDLGRILDPAADRILTVVVVLGLAYRQIIPWWLVVILLARDVVVGVALLVLPGPGWVVIFLGLAVLATEYVWAQRLLNKAKAQAIKAKDLALGKKQQRAQKKEARRAERDAKRSAPTATPTAQDRPATSSNEAAEG